MLARSWPWLLSLCLGACAVPAPSPLPRALLLVDKGRAEEASALLTDYLTKHPDAVAERRLLVRVEASRGQLGAAERQVEELEHILGSKSPVPFVELGHALELSHRYDEALAAYDRAADAAPNDALGPLTGGLRAARWGEPELAEPRLTEATRRGPKDPAAWHALGLVRLSLHNPDGAQQAYRAGLLADPQSAENHVGLATVALSRGDLAAAITEYDAVVALRPRFADAQLGRSFALMGLGRFDEARRALAEATRLGGDRRAIAAQRRELARRTSSDPSTPKVDAGPAPLP